MDEQTQQSAAAEHAQRMREIREWLRRLRAAHSGGYHLADVNVETVIRNTTYLVDRVDGRGRGA